jgi:hypothetical protein
MSGIIAGVAIVGLGVLVGGGGLACFGRLRGDFLYEGGGTRVYAPIASMLLVSIVFSLLFAAGRRLFD